MVLVSALQALELLAVAVVRVREPTVRTPTRCVLWVNLLDPDAVFLGFVLDVFVQASESPFVPPRRASPLTDIGQILERNHRTLVLTSFHNEFVADAVKHQFEPTLFLTTN
ncbi:IS1341-type transposase (plasmid) [Natrarchaeobaculum sulfurireducens]|uniref:IS1341-type transposase n=1 Tax=Natrarchaeobaculum sulfurireducens TaxID=2044521 RepID=A0A346PK44_9EURY|nr:IS1341-type transposase [Natrarchaeobaculum sulfurireducens]